MILLNTISTTIEKTEVIDFYKALLENQSSNYSILINSFIAITLLLIGSTWIWNFVIAKKQIKSNVDERVYMIAEGLRTEFNKLVKDEIIKFQEKINFEFKRNKADIYMQYVLHCRSLEDAETGLDYWTSALDILIDLNEEINIPICTKNILMQLGKIIDNQINMKKFNIDSAIIIVNKVSPMLSDEKNEIIMKLNSLRNI